jgi:heme A synthase
VRLRAVHPLVAILTAGWLAKLTAPLAFSLHRGPQRTWARWAFTAVVAEVCLGLLNIALAAPGWLQLAHLLVAQALWVSLLLTGVATQGGAPAAATNHGLGAVGQRVASG